MVTRALRQLLIAAALVVHPAGAGAEDDAPVTAPPPQPANSLEERFKARGLKLGAPVYLRIFKDTSEIEVWVSRGARYVLFKTFPVCDYSGGLGPKLLEGDKQSPEGLYYIRANDMIVNLRWHRAMDLNFPNSYDRVNARTGSGILIHGKCSSIGCFALTDENVEELYNIVRAALNGGQARVPVLSLPFRMTEARLAQHKDVEWMPFWRELKRAYDLFERDRLPPEARLCGTSYHFHDRRRRGLKAEKLPANCQPLSKPLPPMMVASTAKKKRSDLIPVVAGLSPREAAEQRVKTCDPRELKCRLLKRAFASKVPCPKKYRRCRTAEAAITKSIDCPLKYPRCRGRGGVRRKANVSRVSNARRR